MCCADLFSLILFSLSLWWDLNKLTQLSVCAHCALYCAALRSSRNFINSLCLIVGSFAVLFTDTKGERFCAAGQRLRRSLPLPFNEHQTTRLCKCAGAVLGWGLRAALHYLLSFQVATEAAVRPSVHPSALCADALSTSLPKPFSLWCGMKLCVTLSPCRGQPVFVLLVSNAAHVSCVGGREGREAMLHGREMEGRKEGRLFWPVGSRQHSLRWHEDTAKFLPFITPAIKS